MWYPSWSCPGNWGWFAAGHVVLWALIVYALIVLLRWVAAERRPENRRGSRPQEILRERLARGEIDQGEYEQRMRLLGTGAGLP